MRKLLSEEPMTGTRISQSSWTGYYNYVYVYVYDIAVFDIAISRSASRAQKLTIP